MQEAVEREGVGDLFTSELIELRREIMTLGLIIPLLIVSYLGLVISYQKPFIAALDLRVPSLCVAGLVLGFMCLLISNVRPMLAIHLASWGVLVITILIFYIGQDAYTGVGVTIACGVITLLLGGIAGGVAFFLSGVALLVFTVSNPELGLWPVHNIAAAIGSVMSVIISIVVTRVLFRALKWTQENYMLARQQSVALSKKSVDLELALKSLGQTSFQLARANEQMEVAVQYAEEARQSKQQFAAAVSHELRAPLNLIIGFSDLVLNEPNHYRSAGSTVPMKLLADIRVINKHAQHLLKLVNDILDLSQMDVNYLTVTRAPTQIREVVQSAVNDYQYLAEQRGITLGVDADADLPVIVADATRIRQVLLNLLNNAMRLTDTGGILVRVRCDRQPVSIVNAGTSETDQLSEIVVSVHDTGIGIAPEDIQRIFDPFVQVGDVNRKSGGSGLGLTISRRFVELQGGHMWVESLLGEGSTFYFSLPITTETPASSTQRTPHELQRREVGALVVVERHSVLSRLVDRYIDGIRVDTVQSINDIDSNNIPEIVLINEPMPERSVLLPQPEILGRIPVFRCYVHGALTLPAIENESTENTTHHYLIKPVKREQLYTVLAQMLALRGNNESGTMGRAAQILIVEDEEDALYLLSRMILLAPSDITQGFEGVHVLKARTADAALEYLSTVSDPNAMPIDAVLLDLVLGAGSGYAILAEMEKSPILHDLPVCVITGQVAGGDLLVTPYLAFTRKSGLSARELAQAIIALTRIALPGVDVTLR